MKPAVFKTLGLLCFVSGEVLLFNYNNSKLHNYYTKNKKTFKTSFEEIKSNISSSAREFFKSFGNKHEQEKVDSVLSLRKKELEEIGKFVLENNPFNSSLESNLFKNKENSLKENELKKLNSLNEEYLAYINNGISSLTELANQTVSLVFSKEKELEATSNSISLLEKELEDLNTKYSNDADEINKALEESKITKNSSLENLFRQKDIYDNLLIELKKTISVEYFNSLLETKLDKQNKEVQKLLEKFEKNNDNAAKKVLVASILKLTSDSNSDLNETSSSKLNLNNFTQLVEESKKEISTLIVNNYKKIVEKEEEISEIKTKYFNEADNHILLMKKRFENLNKMNSGNKVSELVSRKFEETISNLIQSIPDTYNYFQSMNAKIKEGTIYIDNYLTKLKELMSNKNLDILKNEKFITILYRTHNSQLYESIKFLVNQNWESKKYYFSEENLKRQSSIINQLLELKKLTALFNDEFASSLVDYLIESDNTNYCKDSLMALWLDCKNQVIQHAVVESTINNSNSLKNQSFYNNFNFLPAFIWANLVCYNKYLRYNIDHSNFSVNELHKVNDLENQTLSTKLKLICFFEQYLNNNQTDKALECLSLLSDYFNKVAQTKENLKEKKLGYGINPIELTIGNIELIKSHLSKQIFREKVLNLLNEHFTINAANVSSITSISNLKEMSKNI